MVCQMVSLMPSLVILEIGNAVDDEILHQVGLVCSHLKKLSISGSAVTDRGIDSLCRGEELCRSLSSLSMLGSITVTEQGLKKCWASFPNLFHFQVQESHLWQLLKSLGRSQQCEMYRVPIKQLELTVGNARYDYLTPATIIFPWLEELTLWSFEPENVSAFKTFKSWENFRNLSTLRLNNVAYCDLGTIIEKIGRQLKLIDLDNFSNEETPSTVVNVLQLAKCCPSLEDLSLTMAYLEFSDQGTTTTTTNTPLMPALTSLTLKGNKFRTADVLQNILLQAGNLVSLTIFIKLEDREENRQESMEPLTDLKISNIFNKNPLTKLRDLTITSVEHHYGRLLLTEESLLLLINNCPDLERVGNLGRWVIEDMDITMELLSREWGWGRVMNK